MRVVRLGLGIVGLAVLLLSGCAGMSTTPYNPVQACQAVGGIYHTNGQCRPGFD